MPWAGPPWHMYGTAGLGKSSLLTHTLVQSGLGGNETPAVSTICENQGVSTEGGFDSANPGPARAIYPLFFLVVFSRKRVTGSRSLLFQNYLEKFLG